MAIMVTFRAAVLTLLFFTGVGAASAQTTLLDNVGTWSNRNGWHVHRSADLKGCVAENTQKDGTLFFLGIIWDDNHFIIGLTNDRTKVGSTKELNDISLSFDGGEPKAGKYTGYDVGGRIVLVGEFVSYGDIIDLVRKSSEVTFRLGDETLGTISLSGSTAALKASFACQASSKGLAGGSKRQQVAQSDKLNGQAVALYGRGKFIDAEPAYRSALLIRQNVFGPDDLAVAESLNNLGAGLTALGKTGEAEAAYRGALTIREKKLGPKDKDVAQTLNNLAALYYDLGYYRDSEEMNRRALEIRQEIFGNSHRLVASSLNNLANTLEKQNALEQSEALHRRALAIREKLFDEDNPDVSVSVGNLANVLQRQWKFEEAEVLQRRALKQRERKLGPRHPEVASNLHNLGNLMVLLQRYKEAEPLYERSLNLRLEIYGNNHPYVADSLNSLAVAKMETGDFKRSEELYKNAIKIKETMLPPSHPSLADSINNYANLELARGQIEHSLELARKAAESGYPRRVVYLKALLASGEEANVDESLRAIQTTARSVSGIALQRLVARFSAGSGELANLIRAEQDASDEISKLNSTLIGELAQPEKNRDATREKQIRDRIAELGDKQTSLRKQLESSFPDYAELSRPAILDRAELQKLLSEDEALVILDVAGGLSGNDYVWAVGRDFAEWHKLPTEHGEIAEAITQLRKELDFANDDRKGIDANDAHTLFTKLLAPVYGRLGDKKHLLFVLNGAVSALPPHLLVSEAPASGDDYKSAHWLVRDHAISVLPSVSSLKLIRTNHDFPTPPKPFIGFGDPVFDATREEGEVRAASARSFADFYRGTRTDIEALRLGLGRLPGTAGEVRAVAESVDAVEDDVLLRSRASETVVKSLPLDQYRIVYFATHGLVAGEVELVAGKGAEPALAFSVPPEATAEDDGLLTASEIAQLKLNADWVVMSACNTAAGEKPGADALSGLARAFFYSGARSLLVSHWIVDDTATAELMKRLFKFVADDRDGVAAGAMQRAMISLMDDSDNPDWADPIYWAPFILVGDPARG